MWGFAIICGQARATNVSTAYPRARLGVREIGMPDIGSQAISIHIGIPEIVWPSRCPEFSPLPVSAIGVQHFSRDE